MTAPRSPSDAKTPRMAPLARLPVFYVLHGKRAVVAGGSAAAAWKIELLSAAGAEVHVYAHEVGEEVRDIAAAPPQGSIVLHARGIEATDFNDAVMAIGAFEDDAEAAAFAAMARMAGVPVNVIDKPAFCDFAFGSIVNRSPLVVGISTDGAAPVFGQAIRAKIEAMLPRGFAHWAAAAQAWRAKVQASVLSPAGRKKFWQAFAMRATTRPEQTPSDHDFADLMADASGPAGAPHAGSVTLVGAGPGDPELLTLRAVRALQTADVILIDDLVAPEVLDFARREAKKMMVGKTGFGPSCRQDEINNLMVSLARAGKRVVRLKGGDPLIFGRAGEEIAACRVAGLAVEVVPGISAAQGAAARLGVSLTERKLARRVQYVTGHDAHGKLPLDLDWNALADPSVTTAIYMPTSTLAELTRRAIETGLPPTTPAIAIARATRPDEVIIAGTLADLPEKLTQAALSGPVLVMIGQVLASTVAAQAERIRLEGAAVQVTRAGR
jgi:uroporphyrin-III C-methyltransferase/precorrin-2 dehydrogenase/sirohydrochlorin ferrochelatase